MTLLDEEEARLLLQARRLFSPERQQADRVRAAVLGSIALHTTPALGQAAAGGSKTSIGAAAAGAGKLGALAAKTWLVALALGLGVSSGVGLWALRSAEPAPRASLAPQPVIESPPAASSEPALVAPSSEPERATTPPASVVKREPARQKLGLRDELLGVRDAEQALNSGNPAQALVILDELGRLPGGELAEERSALRVLAHCQLGSAQARERAQRFLHTHGASVYAPRVRASCEREQ